MKYLLLIIFCLTVSCVRSSEYQCVMRGNCEQDDVTYIEKPCVYDGPPLQLEDETSIEFISKLCPNLNPGENFSVCCDVEQVSSFQDSIDAMAALFKRCPSCYHNLANVFCHLTCSPIQTSFLKVTNWTLSETGNKTVAAMDYYMTERYADDLFDSCSHVQLPFSPDTAMGISCGSHKKDCSPHLWLQYMGKHDPSPYQINFHYEDANITVDNVEIIPMNDSTVPCGLPVTPDGAACSCSDCPCHPDPPTPFPSHDSTIFGVPTPEMVMLTVWWVIAGVIFIWYLFTNRGRPSEEDELLINDTKILAKPAPCDALGARNGLA